MNWSDAEMMLEWNGINFLIFVHIFCFQSSLKKINNKNEILLNAPFNMLG